MKRPTPKVARRPWSDADRLEFASGNILRAKTVPAKRRPGPSAVDWA